MSVLVEMTHVKRYYGRTGSVKKRRQALIKAVDDVSLVIEEGMSLALIGESGSGKTTLGKLVAGLERVDEGKILFQGKEIQNLSGKEMRKIRKNMQMIFQSSGGVFDPRYTIGESIAEVLKNYETLSATECRDRVCEVLEKTGLERSFAGRYVKSLSGGQCQRANIARALVLRPKLVICDEPVASLDYSIRKQMLNLLNEMREEYGLTYLLITHDLSNVPYVCQHVAIMYQGRIVEYIKCTDNIQEKARHPYTRLLFHSIPVRHPRERRLLSEYESQAVSDTVESGCVFCDRCSKATEQCRQSVPELQKIATGHFVACHCWK